MFRGRACPAVKPRAYFDLQTGKSMISRRSNALGTTLVTKPAMIPQYAPSAVIRRLQTLMMATGPHDDAKTVPAK